MTKVAIYARYSSDKQREASIEDQFRLCEERAASEGWRIARTYSDQAMSGASLMRPGILELMQDARDGNFDIILAESLDRISRDQEDIAGIYKRLSFAGIEIFTLSEGLINELHIGLKGTMGALYLKDLADKTRRGLRGRVEAGKSGGGNSYGYDVVRSVNEAGELERGKRKINDGEAAIIRHIFNEYTKGKSPRAIALTLNMRNIPGPTGHKDGKGWGPSTINGNWKRGTGILNNELYIGRLIWNRLTYMKNPDTGKRVSRLNPETEWIIKDVPEMRIIDETLWEKVKDRQKGLHHEKAFYEKQRPRKLLSYLLKCGCCGGGMSKISAHLYGCSTARNKGTCDNRLTVRQDELEGLVLSALQSRLMDPALLEEFCAEYTRHLNALRNEQNTAINTAKADLTRLAKERGNLIQAIKDGVPASEIKDDLARIATKREDLETLLDGVEEEPVLLHPNMANYYRQQVENLAEALNSEENSTEAADLIRTLVDRITLTPNKQGKLDIDLFGDLAGILSLAANKKRPLDESDRSVRQVKMVAGAGFEPATFRL
jgi:site-specific DNA recombinase